MTEDDSQPSEQQYGSEDSRRSFIKKGALASGAAALGISGVGSAAAQVEEEEGEGEDDEDDFQNQEQKQAAMFSTSFRPGGRFIITSPVIDWTPDVEQNIAEQFGQFNTRVIQYIDTNEQVLFFMAQDAEVPNYNEDAGFVVDGAEEFGIGDTVQPEVYTFGYDQEVFGGQNRSGIISVTFTPIEEDVEQGIFENGDPIAGAEGEDAVGGGEEGVFGAEQADEGFVGAEEDRDFEDNDEDQDAGIFF